MYMRTFAIIAALIIIGCGIAFFVITNQDAPDQAVLARILGKQNECASVVSNMTRLGMIKRIVKDGSNDAYVYVDAAWAAQSTEAKLSQSTMIYCSVTPADGYFTVTVRNMQGENIFRIKNGRVAPWY